MMLEDGYRLGGGALGDRALPFSHPDTAARVALLVVQGRVSFLLSSRAGRAQAMVPPLLTPPAHRSFR